MSGLTAHLGVEIWLLPGVFDPPPVAPPYGAGGPIYIDRKWAQFYRFVNFFKIGSELFELLI